MFCDKYLAARLINMILLALAVAEDARLYFWLRVSKELILINGLVWLLILKTNLLYL